MPLFCELCFLTRLRAIYLLLPAIPGPDDREYGNANPGYMYEVHEICRISPDKLEKTISTCGSSQYSPVRMSAFVLQPASYDTDTDHFQAVTIDVESIRQALCEAYSICRDFINRRKYLVSSPSSLAAAARLPSVCRRALMTNSLRAALTPSR
jgi:hypothetical protein